MKTIQVPSQSKEKLLDAAERMMRLKGFEATTVDEICEAAKVTKGCFFHYFQTKEDLGKELVERFVSCARESIQSAPFQKEKDPLKRVYGYVDFAIAKALQNPCDESGCLLGTFAQELSDTYPEIRKCCEGAFQRWIEAFKSDLDLAKAQAASRAHFETRSLAEHFIAVLEGSLILSKARKDPSVVKTNLLHFKNYLKALFGR